VQFRKQRHNANRHTARGITALERSLEDGWIGAITTAADGETFDGSARLEVVERKGLAEPLIVHTDGTRPVVVVRDDIASAADPKAQRLSLAANRVAELDLSWDVEIIGGFDAATLADLWTPAEISTLGQQWADAEAAGDDTDAADAEADTVAEDAGAQLDKAAELQQKWQVQTGDVWAIGPHRLICGDCREAETWSRVLAGSKVNGVFTSPPYAEQRKAQYGGVPAAKYVAWWEAVQDNVQAVLAADGSFFVNIKPHCADGERVLYVFDLVLAMQRKWGWRFVDELTWVHQNIPGAWPNRFRNGFEPIYHFARDSRLYFDPHAVAKPSESVPHGPGGMQKSDDGRWRLASKTQREASDGLALPDNVLRISGVSAAVSHAAPFPIGLPEFFVRAYSRRADVWCDPFCGSGTTLVAAHKQQRIGYGIEQLPTYCAVILERLADLGLTPQRVQHA